MRISISNLHNMCENNTFFLSKAWRYFRLNGHTVTDEEGEADLVFIGGCAVTDGMRAHCERTILKIMRQTGRAQVVIFGCLAAFPEGLRELAGRDAGQLHIIPYREANKLDELIQARIPFEAVGTNHLEGHVPYQPRMGPRDSYVLVAQGCVNSCSYCNIKKVKGGVLSRPEEAIEEEVKGLSATGIRTVTLLADDCGSYGLDRNTDLAELLVRLGRAAPDMRYKLYTVFPSLFLEQAARLDPLIAGRRVPYVCLPVQSAAPRVLGLMNRQYDPDRLAGCIRRLRALDPGIFVYSHFIFNFPTETWDEFEQSIAFARHFDHCVFIGYGENSGTRAAAFTPKCDARSLQAKVQRLEDLIENRQLAAFVVPSP